MNRYIFVFPLILLIILAFQLTDDNLFKVQSGWPDVHYSFKDNPIRPTVVHLGRVLFYDPILSRDGKISCASCHSPYNAFAHVDHALSHGIEDRIGRRNAPVLLNLAWSKSFMQDGAIHNLDMQPLFPIKHPDEMGETLEHVIFKLQRDSLYPLLFSDAFGDTAITGEHLFKALSQFLLTLVSSNAKYDSVMRGESVFSEQQQRGYVLFKNKCASCHAEPLFTNGEFANIGLPLDTVIKDYGRMAITKRSMDSLKFKVPSLRNIEYSFPYMHDGRFNSLFDVLKHYDSGILSSATLAPELQQPMHLKENDRVDIMAFLLTLTDRTFLFDPNHSYTSKRRQ